MLKKLWQHTPTLKYGLTYSYLFDSIELMTIV